MTRKIDYFILILILVGTLTGCAKKQLNGSLSAPGAPARPVKLTVKPNVVGNGGKLSVTLPGGESFSGKYKQVDTPVWTGRGPFDDVRIKGTDFRFFTEKYTHEAVAMLSSSQGDKMECRLALRNPYEGATGGGTGACALPQGEKIDIR